MYETAYDIVALAMRYWFVLIVAYILFRLVQNVLLEFSSERTAQKRASGYALGLLEVVEPVGSSIHGRTFALKRENTIGSARKCDIRLQSKMIDALHAAIYQKGNKVFLSDYGTRRGVFLNGRRIRRDVPLYDGDEVALGNVVLLLSISGIEPAARGDSYYYDEEDDDEAADEGTQEIRGDEDGYGEDYDQDDADEDSGETEDSEEYDDDDDIVHDGGEAETGDEEGYDEEQKFDGGNYDEDDDDGLYEPQSDGRMSYRGKDTVDKWQSYGDKRGQEDQW